MDLIAHRGFAGLSPENLPASFETAAETADAIEFDVRPCGTGDPVVFHDAVLDRLTDATGRVDATSPEELRSLSVLGTGTGVPTLDDALDAIPRSVAVEAELKHPDGVLAPETATAPDGGFVDTVVETLAATPHRVTVASFDPDLIAAVADRSRLPTALLTADGSGVDRAAELGCRRLHAPHEWLLAPDSGLIDRARDVGLDVYAWTVRRSETATALADRGVDGCIADWPDVVT
ncbi:glycerophosphodiester phosphodiesterase [Halobacteriales archaeon SW_7_68_16]|nr:MAG: glycerophosphodiester phosphodiesterase [Halobacteriales archaeon SW_7_68_16]